MHEVGVIDDTEKTGRLFDGIRGLIVETKRGAKGIAGSFFRDISYGSPIYFFFLNDRPPPEFSPLPLHAALPICPSTRGLTAAFPAVASRTPSVVLPPPSKDIVASSSEASRVMSARWPGVLISSSGLMSTVIVP